MTKDLTPLQAIRANCIECSGGSKAEVRRCVIPHCPLYPFRMGKKPQKLPKIWTDEERQVRSYQLAAIRPKKGEIPQVPEQEMAIQ